MFCLRQVLVEKPSLSLPVFFIFYLYLFTWLSQLQLLDCSLCFTMASKEVRTDESDKMGEAVGGMSEAEVQMIQTLRTLGFQPQVGSMADVVRLSRIVTELQTPSSEFPGRAFDQLPRAEIHHYPKFSIFFGEEGRGEVNWDTFKYEVTSVMETRNFSEEQILFGMRRALKGGASDKLRRLGPRVSLREVLEKLQSDYGTIETSESIMKKFYTCEQKANECVESFAARLEELFDKAVELKGLDRHDRDILKQVLHSGLRRDLKLMSAYQCDKESSYDEFKGELRRLEADLKDTDTDKKPCKPAVQPEKKEEDSEIKQLLKQINERIDKLEKGQNQTSSQATQQSNWRNRRPRRGGSQKSYDNKQNKPSDPKAEDTFAPTCFLCHQRGHVQYKCPIILAQLVCSKCKSKGHSPKDCPN